MECWNIGILENLTTIDSWSFKKPLIDKFKLHKVHVHHSIIPPFQSNQNPNIIDLSFIEQLNLEFRFLNPKRFKLIPFFIIINLKNDFK